MRRLAVCLCLVLSLAVAACGDDDSGGSSAASGASPGAEAGAFPVTVKHAFGSTTIKSEPKRVVTVGLRDQDSALGLGVKAVGAMDWFQEDTFAKWPWENWGDKPPAVVSSKGFDINYERVAAQRPDLILSVYQELKKTDYARLSKIAPVVAYDPKYKPYTMPWRLETQTIARSVGRPKQGQEAIDKIDARFAQVRKEHPEFRGKEAIILDPGSGPFFAFTSKDPRGQFLKEMGFKSSTRIDKISKDGFGANVSDERLDLLDVDYLFLLIDKKARRKVFSNPVFKRLDVVKRGRVIELPYYDKPQYGAAVAFNTVLSLPYAIDGTLKQIAAAKAAAPSSAAG